MPRETADTLGEFLRARRGQIGPEQAGLPAGPRRRVPGLRREEVAQLAGISPEYYLRLEQGRNLNPSDQILTALATALQLDEDAVAYLHRLAHPAPPVRRPRGRAGTDRAGLQPLLDSWPRTAAYVQGAGGRVVAANRLAVLLCPFFAVGSNPLRAAFLEPEMRSLYPQWDDMTAKAVSGLRAMIDVDEADAELLATIGELTVASERFSTLWTRREVRRRDTGRTRFHHPAVGELDLHYEKLVRPQARELLVLYYADEGSVDAERLDLLGREA
ncbi:helix-turn-helix domain-containing protein [Streptomyces sp. VRA16 Mangrove soil]|uniref:helix-turn-helix domain-containing protein n=1 Tax=Streptomyces sp. VRA16 Mangrove soil TaxID=2817434 RepID=UPI001A9F1648|nr:helix-turn-helix transcriptional regulator [Streptomyces sp. VRA16 Mangrove soil]MBO1332816.1 helix-turn-helix domain-containing protein [Streptomyces sp. VRA16 Mangrove soil]